MKRIALVVAACLAGVLIVNRLAAQPAPAKPASRVIQYTLLVRLSYPSLHKAMWGGAATKFYKLHDETGVPAALNRYGADGWELVALTDDAGGAEPSITTYYFKRVGDQGDAVQPNE